MYRAYKRGREAIAASGSLWTVMIRDGAMYFGMISLANLANILVFYLGDSNTAGGLSWCTSAISVTMMVRLMLNLHQAAAPDEGSTHTTNLESIRFAYSRTMPEDGLGSDGETGEEEV
ncbi:hypothetical protein DFH07DRAFT_130697 [Mycena maculata]|uniref:Uncharacterized protein n=1 Tax=Mycena maculata TaxID=230809 RepID=A0AAD7I4I6_9AGAR|nr:hypothetical protein DFH07DRAFT_130697 [Mycena maculata]